MQDSQRWQEILSSSRFLHQEFFLLAIRKNKSINLCDDYTSTQRYHVLLSTKHGWQRAFYPTRHKGAWTQFLNNHSHSPPTLKIRPYYCLVLRFLFKQKDNLYFEINTVIFILSTVYFPRIFVTKILQIFLLCSTIITFSLYSRSFNILSILTVDTYLFT